MTTDTGTDTRIVAGSNLSTDPQNVEENAELMVDDDEDVIRQDHKTGHKGNSQKKTEGADELSPHSGAD